jgi:membrane protein YqaA with SNARE-associated domain
MKKSATKIYNWATKKAASQKAPLWLGFLFLLELALFIPLDAVLMFFCLQKRNNIFLYVMIATIASTLSGLVGYLLGHFLWDLIGGWVVPHLISTTSFANLSGHVQQYENWAIFFGGLLPFPLKALSLISGVFQLGIVPFVTCLAAARLLRFSLIGGAMAMWGEKVKAFVDRHFHRIFMLIGAKTAAAMLFFWMLAR